MPRTKRNRRYFYDRVNRVKYLLDEFGDPYFFVHRGEDTKTLSITLPKTMIKDIDERRGEASRSRFIRKGMSVVMGTEQ